MKHLIRNRDYLLLFFGMALSFGAFAGAAVSIAFFVLPFGFNPGDTSQMTAVLPIFGIIGAVIGSQILKKYKKFKLFIGFNMIVAIAVHVYFLGMLYTENILAVMSATALIGLVLMP